ncbi:glycoside hydrolase family 2 protein [Belliella pelovolcani]|uniref:Glycosyl hydrolases family 2 n=1 Tax=Belliella pelovolcani TaxID=529505 RepID=A0A1N7NWQ8_9BACT|nr:sugar-binding domain-containing protein [Belliella pelovolcani]SIT02732.1 Glycosyl hydrolases family 2 [Belliella pelovolcani]
MKRLIVLLQVFLIGACLNKELTNDQELQKPIIQSPWVENPDEIGHDFYPRPQMKRANWENLNGFWDYAILPKGEKLPTLFDGQIRVPFAVESDLSGVLRKVGENQELWYRRSLSLNSLQDGKRFLLHFGGVDWESEVFVNGKSIGVHRGGYDPFSFDITPFIISDEDQELCIRVWDPSDQGPQPRGKQVNIPNSIWYTPVTGIWQTVWLEEVPEFYISSLKNTPDFDKKTIEVLAIISSESVADKVVVKALDEGMLVAETAVTPGEKAELKIQNPKQWSPKDPFLYDIEISLMQGDQELDKVYSYAALRKISQEVDENGIQRMMLNGEFLFQYGPLDQGWWPDGLYTAPNEEAMLFDILKTKEMGFNMIRKHVKVEPAQWYYHCDRLGMLVWQDMPNGDHGNVWEHRLGIVGKATDKQRSQESEQIYLNEWKAIIDANYNFPSIVVWVPFNEAWGQFNTKEVTEWTIDYDKTRLVNSASGGNFIMDGSKITGHMIDLHSYPEAVMPDPNIFGKDNILVLGEFGGLGLPIAGHTWQNEDNWGYQSFTDKEDLANRYKQLIDKLEELIQKGLSAAVYTQTTDVEIEVNGLMTYDRKVIKLDRDWLRSLHQKLYDLEIQINQ